MEDYITPNLLSEVFTDGQQDFRINRLENNVLYYSWLKEEYFGDGDVNCKWVDMQINIYELAHKCKEWAFKKGLLYWYENNKLFIKILYSCKVDFNIYISIYDKPFDIIIDFKACDWILKQKSGCSE